MKLILILLLPICTFAQSYERSKDDFLKESYVRFYNRDAGIIVQKTFPLERDTLNAYYEVALVVHKDAKSVDDIMRKRGVIVFEDKTFLVFTDQVNFDFLMEGKRRYTLTHKLTSEELHLLQIKKIDFINFIGQSTNLDKWQKRDYQKVFNKIVTEKL